MSFLTSSKPIPIPRPQSFPFPLSHHFLKRRRLKRPFRKPKLVPFLLRHLLDPPSSPHLDFSSILTAAVGLASAAALFSAAKSKFTSGGVLSKFTSGGSGGDGEEVGEWILFTSPTPFNRFVLLRCPSIAFEGGEMLEDVNEKLIKEERHYVRLDSGRIVKTLSLEEREREELVYQRVCVAAEDGGVISLDWPANLELKEERGLDTTVLIVPGTTEGSMEKKVREFVRECLRRGLFPIVMNPRGCAASPITTPRLFTAADSDDVCSAIQFIKRERSWSTLTGVGWGYGANMLTKYLAEAGEKTPLTAATCIDNPFDLDEATRTSPYSAAVDKKVSRGLIDILKCNKELFQGRRKGFDVEKALAAESIRDFDNSISMVSYGFNTIEDFYANSSTRTMVGNLKIPVLFIQNDDGTVPLFSIPRGLIAENPFTSLLLCSCVPSSVSALSWYHQVTIEWLAAVELGLLKGRHPLLQDIDVNINPSKGLALMEGRTSDAEGRFQGVLELAELDSSDAYLDSVRGVLTESDAAAVNLKNNQCDQLLKETSDISLNSLSVEADSSKDGETYPEESDTGQVLQSAQVVMNMLDVTMPGTLKEEEKRKVLEAVGQGETVIKALQDAVPEDVRGKLTASVSEILQTRGKNLNLDGLLSINQITNVSSRSKSNIREKASKQPDKNIESNGRAPDSKIDANDTKNSNNNNHSDVDKLDKEGAGSRPLEKSLNLDQPESDKLNGHSDDPGLAKVSTDSQNSDGISSKSSAVKDSQLFEFGEGESDTAANVSSSDQNVESINSPGASSANRSQYEETDHLDSKESNMSSRVENVKDLSNGENNSSSAADVKPADKDEALASPTSEAQLPEEEDNNRSKDDNIVEPLPDQNRAPDPKTPSFSVTQALDALTGLDDSTQVAVNSVFGVIEEMITQLEEKKNENAGKKDDDNTGAMNGSAEKNCSSSELQMEKQLNGEDPRDARVVDVESDIGGSYDRVSDKEDSNNIYMVSGQSGANNSEKSTNIYKTPSNLTADPFAEALYKEYLGKYMLSKLHNVKSYGLDTTGSLFLHYVPDEGHWILLEKPSRSNYALSDNSKVLANENDIIEPPYVVLDKDGQEETANYFKLKENLNDEVVNCESNVGMSKFSVRTILLDSLKVEVTRRLGSVDMKDMETGLAADLEDVVDAVRLAIQRREEHNQNNSPGYGNDVQESSRLDGTYIIEAISKSYQDTTYLKRVLPVGVIVGSTLAALRNCEGCVDAVTVLDSSAARVLDLHQQHTSRLESEGLIQENDIIQVPANRINGSPIVDKNQRIEEGSVTMNSLKEDAGKQAQSKMLNRDTVMVGAMTAAMGASAFLTSQQEGFMGLANDETTSNSQDKHMKKEYVKLGEAADNKQQSNILTSLAEKAMSVAAPVVPTKEDGEVDQDRLVALLAEFGQRGGLLRLVAKVALLWGGLRGAMSLTDRLISFLRVAERPLVQRLLGFFCMTLVIWSPVLVPLLPTLLHNMATHNSSKIGELACIFGLYTAVTILIMKWGETIRGYKYPLKQYGLDFLSPRKVQDFLIGLGGGFSLVMSIHFVNTILGLATLSLPLNLSSSSFTLAAKFKAYGQVFLLAGRGLLVATAVAFVEELLFRSWLLEEIAADLGYHPGIILSGLAFALSQRSFFAIPGLWLLSMCLAGARLRKDGSLFIPIGLRAGIMSSSFILHTGGFLIYQPNSQFWIAGMHPLQPFTGVVGLVFALLSALALYPRKPGLRGRVPRIIRV